MSPNLRLLRLLATVTHQHSFSRAGATLHLSHPAVSKGYAISKRRLAALVGAGGQGVILTEAGGPLMRHAATLSPPSEVAEEKTGPR
jgi:DNA-binding transcriptional LysR family regulator